MTKFKIATGIAILGLAAPVFAGTTPASPTAVPSAKTAQLHQRNHKKVAAAEENKASEKKVEKKHKGHVQNGAAKDGAKKNAAPMTEAAPASATPAPAPAAK